jgi:hypothetical protein
VQDWACNPASKSGEESNEKGNGDGGDKRMSSTRSPHHEGLHVGLCCEYNKRKKKTRRERRRTRGERKHGDQCAAIGVDCYSTYMKLIGWQCLRLLLAPPLCSPIFEQAGQHGKCVGIGGFLCADGDLRVSTKLLRRRFCVAMIGLTWEEHD